MITELTLRNFKSISDQTFQFTDFDLLVGRNNSGKSTILQAMAIWQYCIDEFHRMKSKSGNQGVQIILPNFTALPLPEFNLIWEDKIIRSREESYILIDIILKYKKKDGSIGEFGISLRYQSPQSIYAIPQKGWNEFKKLDQGNELPRIVYVPPFSGLDPTEKWVDDGVLRQNVGKGQPGSVLRNLLYRVIDKNNYDASGKEANNNWDIIAEKIKSWFGVQLLPPKYEKGVGINIEVKYEKEKGKDFDIISGGSGFHQALTILAFYYGYEGVTTMLFDEPDAHLHVNLQREILGYFQEVKGTQFIIATHAEEFIKGVSPQNIISVLKKTPERISSSAEIITALSDISNMAIVSTIQQPYILYLEGEDDERILNGWSAALQKEGVLNKFYIHILGGGTKDKMREFSDKHFNGLKKIVPKVQRLILFDYDSYESFHPKPDNPAVFEWKRKNIENYLLVPDVWRRAVEKAKGTNNRTQIEKEPEGKIIDEFFESQNLTLPKGKTWKNVDANIFSEVNGKKILFEDEKSLYQLLKAQSGIKIGREILSNSFVPGEIHEDIINLFAKLESIVKQ